MTNTTMDRLVVSLTLSVMLGRGTVTLRGIRPYEIRLDNSGIYEVITVEVAANRGVRETLTIALTGAIPVCNVTILSVHPMAG